MTTQPPTDAARELLPCPFCGADPVIDASGMKNDGLMILCMTEGCVAPHVSYIPPSAAIAAWNTRQQPEAGREGEEPWAWGWYERGGTKRAYGYLPTVDYPRDPEGEPFPLYRHPAATRLAVPTVVGREEVARVREALTPHGETKAAYMGEFSWTQWLPDQNGVEQGHERVVPWNTIKEIMAAIRERAGIDKLDEADALSLLSHAEAGGVEGNRFANDVAAKKLYDGWRHVKGWVPWVERGNSDMQEKARRLAADPWRWWAGRDEEEYRLSGPCLTREQAIDEAYGDTEPGDVIYLVEAIAEDEADGDGIYPFVETRNRGHVIREEDAELPASPAAVAGGGA